MWSGAESEIQFDLALTEVHQLLKPRRENREKLKPVRGLLRGFRLRKNPLFSFLFSTNIMKVLVTRLLPEHTQKRLQNEPLLDLVQWKEDRAIPRETLLSLVKGRRKEWR
jgi:hypothetical protein